MRIYRVAMALFAALTISAAASAAPAGFQRQAPTSRLDSNAIVLPNRAAQTQNRTAFTSRDRRDDSRYRDGSRSRIDSRSRDDHRYEERGRKTCYVQSPGSTIFSFAVGVLLGSTLHKEKPACKCANACCRNCESCRTCPANRCTCDTCRKTCCCGDRYDNRCDCRDNSCCTGRTSCSRDADRCDHDNCACDTNCRNGCR